MISLPQDWDDDVYAEAPQSFSIAAQRTTPSFKPPGRPSKAAELLQRISQAPDAAMDVARDSCWPTASTDEALLGPLAESPASGAVGSDAPWAGAGQATSSRPVFGVFDDVELPSFNDEDVRHWTSAAPRALDHSFSFRASMRGKLLALPVTDASSGGKFRLK